MRKTLLSLIVFLLLCSPAWAASFTVCASGCDYTTIQAAIDAASDNTGNTIEVQAGYTTTTEVLTVNKSGASALAPLRIYTTSGKTVKGVTISKSYIEIDGFTITPGPAGGVSDALIIFSAANISNVKIMNNILKDAVVGAYGIQMYFSGMTVDNSPSSCTFSGNTFTWKDANDAGTYGQTSESDYPRAMMVLQGVGHIVSGNDFSYVAGGDVIYIFGHDHTITGNTFHNITYQGTDAQHTYQNSQHPDLFQSYSAVSYNILIEKNFIRDSAYMQIGQVTQDCAEAGVCADYEGTATSVGSTTFTDSTKEWTTNGNANKLLHILSGTAIYKIYLIVSNSGTVLTVTDLEGNAVNLASDGVAEGDSYCIQMRAGWWTFRNNIFINIGTTDGGYFGNYAPYCKWHNNTFFNVNVGTATHSHIVEHYSHLHAGRGWYGEVKNNIFLGCGEVGVNTKGWYTSSNPSDTGVDTTTVHSNNYVANADFSAKTGFSETGGVGSGNPYLSNTAGSLAINFSLTAQSTILIGAGANLSASFTDDYAGTTRSVPWDIGAYEWFQTGNINGITASGVTIQ